MKTLVFLTTLLLSLPMMGANAAFVYHGALQQANGENLTAEQRVVHIQFRLYNTPAKTGAEDCLWSQVHENVTCDTNGAFSVAFTNEASSTTAGALTFAQVLEQSDNALYLGLTVVQRTTDNEGKEVKPNFSETDELAPRQALITVPIAATAVAAQRANDFVVEAGNASANQMTLSQLTTKALTFPEEVEAEKATITTKHVELRGALKVAGNATIKGPLSTNHGVKAKTIAGAGAAVRGMILPWYPADGSSTPPEGWVLCNGQNGTPDLRNRFVRGGARNASLGTGGEDAVTLKGEELPQHYHNVYYTYAKIYDHNWKTEWDDDTGGHYWVNQSRNPVYSERKLNAAGSKTPQAHENRPPFQAVYFIMYVGNSAQKGGAQ